ncbi:MAG: alpha/beta fold hydrolase [Candidatus Melainabacteria bacterium]|jgi:predicted alpha/beta-fold hydrolase|nr:alpha/beta fold hydrolase [Candidatus Melainabacteria bacterium]
MTDFVPHPLLAHAHLMTIVPGFLPRPSHPKNLPAAQKCIIEVASGSSVLTYVHLQPNHNEHPTLLIIHGLEGSSESAQVRGLCRKALTQKMNVVRMNMRNCGGTLHLSNTLYNGGMSADVITVARHMQKTFGLKDIFVAGFSLGGNLALKAAGELGDDAPGLFAGVCTVSPSIDLNASVESLARGINKIYELHFLRGLTAKIRQKSALFPEKYDVEMLKLVKTIKDFDDKFTAPDGGYGNADNYYKCASSINFIEKIRVPTLIIASKDDPIVPFESFLSDKLKSNYVTLLTPEWGGHSGFLGAVSEATGQDRSDRFWAEHRVVAFCLCKNPEGA